MKKVLRTVKVKIITRIFPMIYTILRRFLYNICRIFFTREWVKVRLVFCCVGVLSETHTHTYGTGKLKIVRITLQGTGKEQTTAVYNRKSNISLYLVWTSALMNLNF